MTENTRHETPDVAELRRRLDALPGFALRHLHGYGRRCDGDPVIDCVGNSDPMPAVGPVPEQEVLL